MITHQLPRSFQLSRVRLWLAALICLRLVVSIGIASESAGRLSRTNLLTYLDRTGNVREVRSVADWRKRRTEILRAMQQIMGPFPAKERRCALNLKTLQETNCGPYLRRLITYAAEPGSRTPAFLLIPQKALQGKTRLPAVLALHPTDMDYGHRVVVEPLRSHYSAYAAELAELGYVVLAPSYPLMAQYQPDLQALGYQSGTMKAIWDNVRGLDLLESLPFVKKGRFGAIGHSLGGHNAIFTAVFDDRIKVIVSSCGFDSFRDYYGGNQDNWQPGRGWCQDRYMPKLATYRGRLGEIPFDFYELIAALAPRQCFINAPLRDANFQWRSVDQIAQAAAQVYELYREGPRLQVEHPDCEHALPTEMRLRAYRLLGEGLR